MFLKIYLLTLQKTKFENENEATKSNKRPVRRYSTGSERSAVMFPKICMICSKGRIKVRGKFHFPTKIAKKSAEQTLKNAAPLGKDIDHDYCKYRY